MKPRDKYLSILVVGKGGEGDGSNGAGSGMVVYLKNLEIKTFFNANPVLTEISFDDAYGANFCTKVGLYRSDAKINMIYAGNTYPMKSIYGASLVEYIQDYGGSHVNITSQLTGYGSSGGGGYFSSYGSAGGGGSTGNGNNINGSSTNNAGGTGGDGIFGFSGGSGGSGYVGGSGYSKYVVIPLTSIFGGTGVGGNGRTSSLSAGGGGAGYGNGGSYNFVAGYGSGGSGVSSSSTSSLPGKGIVCLYYHTVGI